VKIEMRFQKTFRKCHDVVFVSLRFNLSSFIRKTNAKHIFKYSPQELSSHEDGRALVEACANDDARVVSVSICSGISVNPLMRRGSLDM
jgi:hypothetical protein